MRIETEDYLDFSQVLLKPKRSKLTSRSQANLTRDFKFLHADGNYNFCPIIGANMTTVGTMSAAIILENNKALCALHKFYKIEDYVLFYFTNRDSFFTIGSKQEDFEKYLEVSRRLNRFPNICIDVANGYSETFVDFAKRVRDTIKSSAILMAGNVATPEITEELILNGVDIVKCGIGSGAVCTTRSVTGVGIPQFTCVVECADAAHGVGGMICSDGGITCPGDVVKAFGAGADFVMIGTEFAAHYENSDKEKKLAVVYGMSSTCARQHYSENKNYISSEGRVISIPVRGPLQDTIDYYFGGIRSGMTYIGAEKIKDIPKRATFIKVAKILNDSQSHNTKGIR